MSSRPEKGNPPTSTLEPRAPLPSSSPKGAPKLFQKAGLTLISFGFKYGAPRANHVFDVSFLRNPARQSGWTLWSEPGADMRSWVLEQPEAVDFLNAVLPLARFLASTDDDVRIAFGCSAGRHRSTILVEEVAARLGAEGIALDIEHRERSAA